jgi:hypothetical protein
MELKELNNFPPAEDSWSNEQKEEYNNLLIINRELRKLNALALHLSNDPETELRRKEYLSVKSQDSL